VLMHRKFFKPCMPHSNMRPAMLLAQLRT
jgi:hypothetical protein